MCLNGCLDAECNTKFRIYYGDGTTFNRDNGLPCKAPKNNVQVIVVDDPEHGWTCQAGGDYYVWDKRGDAYQWWGVDLFGLYDYLLRDGCHQVLFGLQLTNKEFSKIMAAAKQDPYFGDKTAYRKGERRP